MGRVCLVSPEGLRIAGTAVAAEIATLTLAYFMATVLNIRILVPRLLLRNRFTAYMLSLLGFTVIFIAVETGFERLLIDRYHLTPGKDWYFSDDSILGLALLSSIAAYFISIAGTAIVIFLRLWSRSGERMRDLEEQSARSRLEKVRTRIDSGALFDTLEKAANTVCRSPSEASGMLMKLSKSLRTQLYESEYRQPAAPQELSAQTFNLSSPFLNFLTDKRYRLWRHLLMITGFLLVMITNIDGTWSSFLFTLPLSLFMYLILIYLNIYVLFPKLMMRNRTGAYLAAVTLSVCQYK